MHVLNQKLADAGVRLHRLVELQVGARGVGAHGDEVLLAGVARLHFLELLHAPKFQRSGDGRHHAADRRLQVDGRKVPLLGQTATEHDVAVENGAHVVGDRVLLVVAFHQHGVERGDAAAALRPVARALHQRRQLGEHRGRKTARRRGLACGQRHFAQRQGVAGDRIHQQQHVQPLVAVILGHRGGQTRAANAGQRRGVGRGGHHDGPAAPFHAQNVFDELFDLTAPLADEAHHDDVGIGVARHHAQQHALAHAAAREQPHARATAHGEQRIDRAHAHVERLAHQRPGQRVDLLGGQGGVV